MRIQVGFFGVFLMCILDVVRLVNTQYSILNI